jgi:hypothetical protein
VLAAVQTKNEFQPRGIIILERDVNPGLRAFDFTHSASELRLQSRLLCAACHLVNVNINLSSTPLSTDLLARRKSTLMDICVPANFGAPSATRASGRSVSRWSAPLEVLSAVVKLLS